MGGQQPCDCDDSCPIYIDPDVTYLIKGYNLVTYEGPMLPVGEAMASVQGNYRVIDLPHNVNFSSTYPDVLNTLKKMSPGDWYWIQSAVKQEVRF